MMNLWQTAFQSVKEVRASGTRALGKSVDGEGARAGGGVGGVEGEDWWDDVSHQAQRVAHVTAASAFASGGGEVRTVYAMVGYGCLVYYAVLEESSYRRVRGMEKNGGGGLSSPAVFLDCTTVVMW